MSSYIEIRDKLDALTREGVEAADAGDTSRCREICKESQDLLKQLIDLGEGGDQRLEAFKSAYARGEKLLAQSDEETGIFFSDPEFESIKQSRKKRLN